MLRTFTKLLKNTNNKIIVVNGCKNASEFTQTTDKETHFGFEVVKESEKAEKG